MDRALDAWFKEQESACETLLAEFLGGVSERASEASEPDTVGRGGGPP